MNIFDEFNSIVKEFESHNIRYALVGGVAMAFYGEPRFTRDIDLLINPEDYERAKKLVEENGYFESIPPWTFQNIEITLHRFLKVSDEDEMIFDFLVSETEKHKEIIRNANEVESEEGIIRIANREDLIWLKSIRHSKQDQTDIEKLKNEKDK